MNSNNQIIKKINILGDCFVRKIILITIIFFLAYFYYKNNTFSAYLYWNEDDDIVLEEKTLNYKNIHTVRSMVSSQHKKL